MDAIFVCNAWCKVDRMNESTQKKLLKLLREKKHLVASRRSVPQDYASLIACIFQLELQQELKVLNSMLHDDSDTFAEEFKKRCAWRETDLEHTVPFRVRPDSVTNQRII